MKSPKKALAENAVKVREMHRLYPFTKTVSSAALMSDTTRRASAQKGR